MASDETRSLTHLVRKVLADSASWYSTDELGSLGDELGSVGGALSVDRTSAKCWSHRQRE